MDNKEDLKKVEEEIKVKDSEIMGHYGMDIKKYGKGYSIEKARKVNKRREKRDDALFNFFMAMRVVFIIFLLVIMVLVFKYIKDHVHITM